MTERPLPPIPPDTSDAASAAAPSTYFLVTPQGLAAPVQLGDLPLRAGQHQSTVHRAAFSFFQARTDDGLPAAGEAVAKATLYADSPDDLQARVSDLRAVARAATWLVHAIEGGMKLAPPVGVDVGAGSRQAEITLHLVAADLRRYRADGSVLP